MTQAGLTDVATRLKTDPTALLLMRLLITKLTTRLPTTEALRASQLLSPQ